MVESLAGMVIPDADICRMVLHDGQPIGETTLKNRFRKELSQGRAKIRVRHSMALMKAIDDGNVTAMIWWDKTRNGVREKLGIDVPPMPAAGDGAAVEEGKTMLEVARRVAFVLSMGAELAKPKAPPKPTPQRQREPA